jgi:hypothetical protein
MKACNDHVWDAPECHGLKPSMAAAAGSFIPSFMYGFAVCCCYMQVLSSQHNLPANSKRSLQQDVFVLDPAHPEQVLPAIVRVGSVCGSA